MSIVNIEALKSQNCQLWWPGNVSLANTPKAITAYGNVTQSTAVTDPWGGSKTVGKFDGSGDYITTPDHSDFTCGTSPFTIEFFFRTTGRGNRMMIFGQITSNAATYSCPINVEISVGGHLLITISSVSGSVYYQRGFPGGGVGNNIWYHVTMCRSGSTLYYGFDGTVSSLEIGSGFLFTDGSTPFTIGRGGDYAALYYAGYMSEFRLSKGIARYTSNYTVPTQPFVTDPYTKLLLHMDGSGSTFIDSSALTKNSGFQILPDGVSIIPTGTFTSIKAKDGRNYWKFNGSTNYITLTDHANWSMFLNDFTISTWVKFDTVAANKVILGQYTDANNQWYLQWTTGNIIQLYGITSSTARFNFSCPLTAVANTWYHIVVQRSGSTCVMYINGVAMTVTTTTAFSATATDIAAVLSIGKINDGYQTGNIKDLQIFTKALTTDQVGALYQETYIY